jgi:hypothetical protein
MGWLRPVPIDDEPQRQSRAPSHPAPKSEPGATLDGANAPGDQRLVDEPMILPVQPHYDVTCNMPAVGSRWQCRWSSRQCFWPQHRAMTSTSISTRSRQVDQPRWRSIRVDLVFWTLAGGLVAALSRPLADWWNASRSVLLVGGLAFVVLGPILLLGLNRIRPTTRGLVASFVVTNFLLAPIVWAAAIFGWLRLSAAGNWALADAGVVMLVLGIWQLTALRPRD